MDEQIIVTLTTWSARVGNIPVVLDTIFAQTLPPDLVVLNVAYDLDIPPKVQNYLENHNVEIFRCPDSKVYKKLFPTLKRYPKDCVISIDDDWLYPKGMIADFMEVHNKYPQFPISGNHVILYGMQCHCGCASLTKAEFFGDNLYKMTDDDIAQCPSDDIAYTYFSNKNGHPYIRSRYEYFENMESYNANKSYTCNDNVFLAIDKTYHFLVGKYGIIELGISYYIQDSNISQLLVDIVNNRIEDSCSIATSNAEKKIRNTTSFRLGKFLLSPFSKIKSIFQNYVFR